MFFCLYLKYLATFDCFSFSPNCCLLFDLCQNDQKCMYSPGKHRRTGCLLKKNKKKSSTCCFEDYFLCQCRKLMFWK